jgi:hypothetical protein
MESFVSNLSESEKEHINAIRKLIVEYDTEVKESPGHIMSTKNTLNYNQEGVFKYGLAKTKDHFSFHSMVMYAYPEIADYIKSKTKGLKFQKGCINFPKAEDFPLETFREMLKLSADKDFSPVLQRYKK